MSPLDGYDRRSFVAAALAGIAAPAWASPNAMTGAATSAATGRLIVRPDRVVNRLAGDYVGLSVEKAQLSDPTYYHPENKSLIALLRRLSPRGVLRIGGNTSDFCWWKAQADAPAPTIHAVGWGKLDNGMPQRQFAVTPAAVRNLRIFLEEAGWTCIWGLNLGTASPNANADEAGDVAKILGNRLKYLQIGNEPDLYGKADTLLRSTDWTFDSYLDEWVTHARAVLSAAPKAFLAGPDVAANTDWILRFAETAPKRLDHRQAYRLVGLSGHYYAGGPPDNPQMTIANLLSPSAQLAHRMDQIAAFARASGRPFRITEANSCYRGGKPGVSDTFAAALWGADYMLNLGAHGCQGVHFHGGSGAMIASSLGDKLPGARTDAERKSAQKGAFYTPIAGNRETGFFPRPLYYGMLLGANFAATTLLSTTLECGGANATAYAARNEDGLLVAVFNKDGERDLALKLMVGGAQAWPTRAMRLGAPALSATEGIGFTPTPVEDGRFSLIVPRASAVLAYVLRGS